MLKFWETLQIWKKMMSENGRRMREDRKTNASFLFGDCYRRKSAMQGQACHPVLSALPETEPFEIITFGRNGRRCQSWLWWLRRHCDVTMMTIVYSILIKYNECPVVRVCLFIYSKAHIIWLMNVLLPKQFIKERSVHLLRKHLLLIKCQEPWQKYNHCLL